MKNIAVAARSNPNPQANPSLRAAVDKAREANVPLDNIERALQRAREAKGNAESVIVEVYGPGGVALIIEGATDNRNRFMMELRAILQKYGARVVEPGSARWAFEESGGTIRAKIPQPVSDEDRNTIEALVAALEGHDDVGRAVSNAAWNVS